MINELEEWWWCGARKMGDSIIYHDWIWGISIVACLVSDGFNIVWNVCTNTFPAKIVV